MYRILLLVCFIICAIPTQAQTIEGNNDCTYSKEIVVPFNQTSNGANTTKHHLNQTVFYSYRDQFSYWYKIIVKENGTLKFKISPINDSDEYAVYVYQYNEKDFCNKVYYNKLKSVKPSFFTGNIKDDPYDLTEKTFSAKKDNIYYISVLNTSINNCGHNFYLINENDTLRVKALHLPCKRELVHLSVKDISIKTTQKQPDTNVTKVIPPILVRKDTIKKDSVLQEKPILVCKVSDVKKKTITNATIIIIDEASREEIVPNSEHSYTVEKGKKYKIKCTAFGYKNYEQSITITNQTNVAEILLEPLKAGENVVMKSIYFYPNTYALKKSSLGELEKLLQFLVNNPNIHVEIQGHTNGDHHIAKNKAYSTLGEEWNFEGSAKALSQKRAETIKKYLETNGITADRIMAKGYGGKQPIIKDPQTNEEGQLNIRVELVILKD
ncbi:MAG TPA: OmpA family protein [Bacteroidia bacterium]|nr:OmpA family protein [Bacteroidia bacterium]